MEININSPAYYKQVHGIDNEIYRFCQSIYMHFKDRKYSNLIDIIGIIPIIAPKEKIENGEYREQKTCSVAYGYAVVQLFIDYDRYVGGNMEQKKTLMARNVLDSVRAVKAKGKIDYNRFEQDFRAFCEETGVELESPV